jgi:predicted nucleic acid-binding Zn ribbon protein
MLCPKCGKEIVEGATICKHCHEVLGKPKRPKGVTIIAILILLGSVIGFFSVISLTEMTSIILGIRVPVGFAKFFLFLIQGVGIYCGIGFLKQLAMARKVYIWISIYGIVNSLISTPILISALRLRDNDKVGLMINMVITIIFSGYILYYIIRHKDYFVN